MGLLLPLGLLVPDAARDIFRVLVGDVVGDLEEGVDTLGIKDEGGNGAGGDGDLCWKILVYAGSGVGGEGSEGEGGGGATPVLAVLFDSSARRTTSFRALVMTPARVTRSRSEVVSNGSFSGVVVACSIGEL